MWPILTAGFTLGIISSFHCIGMCGPLAISLPTKELSRPRQIFAVLSYHSGRIITYSFLGLLCGLLGRRVLIAGFQQKFSVVVGLLLLFSVIASHKHHDLLPGAVQRRFRTWIISLWTSPAKGTFLLLGMANGLLPCGMVYMAVAGALASSQVMEGMAFMALFGAGTLPVMLGLSYFGRLISLSFRNRIKKTVPYLLTAMALLLILRGLNLGIPFISPALTASRGHTISCQ